MKKGFLETQKLDEAELKEINKFTKRSLTADEVYAFSVVLCDNDIDRDFERFTPDSLKKLAELYIGKTGIFDHSMKGKDQVARIYSTALEETGEVTSDSQPYIRLKAKAYVPKTPKNEDFILSLEAGITKEVSVGCAVKKEICSICGADRKKEFCGHKKGELYGEGEKLMQCHTLLVEPTDAYEWSFVAVPAQRRAGVVKAYSPQKKGETELTVKDIVKALGTGEITLSAGQSENLKKEFEALNKSFEEYRDSLKKQAVISCSTALPALCGETLNEILDSMSPQQLKAFNEALNLKQKEKTQLDAAQNQNTQLSNAEFVI